MTAAAIDHDTTVEAHGASHRATCRGCGWQSATCLFENDAREAAATHYIAAADNSDDSRELAACMARHPAGQAPALADPIVLGCWRSDPPRAARRLLELPADRQRACLAALDYLGADGQEPGQ